MPGRTVRLLLLVACALVAVACGDAAPQSSVSTGSAPFSSIAQAAPHAPTAQDAAPIPAAPPPGGGTSAGAAGLPAQTLDNGTATATAPGASSIPANLGLAQGRVERSVSARFVVPHDGFLTAFDQVVSRTTALGGYVVNSSTTPDSTGRISSGELAVKVPSARLGDLLQGLPSDFTVSSLNYGSQDHTAETVDLGARLAASIAHRTALEKLRDRTGSIADIASLEQQIAQVQLEVDQEQGALNAVNASVDMATASIALVEKGAKPVTPAPSHSDPALVRALRAGWDNAVQLVAGGVLVLITVLPVAVLVVLAAWLGRRRLRRLIGVRPPSA